MQAKISNKFIDQLFIFSQVNKVFIKECLQKECLKSMIGIDSDGEDSEKEMQSFSNFQQFIAN